jgi:putative Mg2+ transporter-C (MgtC) family protein
MWREAVGGAAIIIAANTFLHALAARMDRITSKAGRDIPPADYILDAVTAAEAESGTRALIIGAVNQPGLRLRALRSSATKVPGEVRLRAELSTATRDDDLLENAVTQLSLDPNVSSASWLIQDEDAVDWTRR